ncbi:MAG: M48 family metalloprotease [Armatimonadetes bacterium]|nr:M48 family metalloprotease [Armatimonadota bacterium]
MNVALIGASALFYLALVSVFYLFTFVAVSASRRILSRAPQSLCKRVTLLALLLPPVAALLPTVAGVVLRHSHGSAAMATATHRLPAEAATVAAHHTMACALIFERVGSLTSFGTDSHVVSGVLGAAAWLLAGAGIFYAARLAVATLRLETGIAPHLSVPSPALLASLERVNQRLALPAPLRRRFFECALPPERSSVMGLTRARCVLSREFIQTAPPEEVDALVAHEAGHLRSGDAYAAFAVGVLNCLFFFLRPVHLLGRRWREAAELAADDVAVRGTGNDPLAVASAILRIKGTSASVALPASLLSFADEATSAQTRVERLLAQAEAEPAVRRETGAQMVFAWGATGLLSLLGAGLLVSSEAACVAHCALELLKSVR